MTLGQFYGREARDGDAVSDNRSIVGLLDLVKGIRLAESAILCSYWNMLERTINRSVR
jgi:hypothetical protein